MSKTTMELVELIDKIPTEPAKDGEFLLPELMAIAVSHEVRNDDIVFAGTGLPMVGIMTANFLHAPKATLIYESGICDGKTIHTPMSVGDQRAANMASSLGGLVDTFGYFLQQGFVTLGFLGGAAIDKYGGVNVTSIGDYYTPQNRFTGTGGNPDIGCMARRTAYIIIQEKRRFVEMNDFVSTPGWWCWDFKSNPKNPKWVPKKEVWKNTPFADCGPCAVVTNMGVYRFDENGIIYLETVHPGVSIEKIKENCGFDINVSKVKGETARPSYKDLFVLREFVDPELLFMPSKPDYTAAVMDIINK
ncbi:MAG: CoA-transferase [Deltaproteobacteria bacterium]